jgi:hypothetical protein
MFPFVQSSETQKRHFEDVFLVVGQVKCAVQFSVAIIQRSLSHGFIHGFVFAGQPELIPREES